MTTFISSYATRQLLPPWKSEGSTCWCFAVPMTPKNVSAYLDKFFNQTDPDDSPFTYEPLPTAQFGLVVVCHQDVILSEAPDNPAGSDRLSHDEVFLAVPVYRKEAGWAPKVVWVLPFVFGSNSTVLFSTREIVGIDMTLADVDYDAADPDQLSVNVEIDAIKTFGPEARSESMACAQVTTGDVSTKGLGDFEAANPDLADFLSKAGESGFFPVPAPLETTDTLAPRDFAPRPCEINTLKQFRDISDMDTAVYRSIVACQITHEQVADIVYFDPDQVEIVFTWSDSVSEILTSLFDIKQPTGSQDGVQVPVKLAYAFTSTVTFKVIQTLHTYGG